MHAQISRWRINAALPRVSDPNSPPNPRHSIGSSRAHGPGSSSLSKLGFFFFVLALQWNPFTPCLAEDVKPCCQGSWMQGKVGWGFLCPELACTVCWSGLCRAVTLGVLTQPAWVLSQCQPFRSQPALSSCPVHRRISPWFQGCCGVSPPTPVLFWQCCLFREVKLSCPRGRITNVKVYLEPKWPSTPAPLSCCPRGCTVPLSPSPSQSSGVPVVSSAALKRMHRCISQVLLWQDSPGTLDHLASLIIVVLFWCAVQWSVQVHTLHRPFGNW